MRQRKLSLKQSKCHKRPLLLLHPTLYNRLYTSAYCINSILSKLHCTHCWDLFWVSKHILGTTCCLVILHPRVPRLFPGQNRSVQKMNSLFCFCFYVPKIKRLEHSLHSSCLRNSNISLPISHNVFVWLSQGVYPGYTFGYLHQLGKQIDKWKYLNPNTSGRG